MVRRESEEAVENIHRPGLVTRMYERPAIRAPTITFECGTEDSMRALGMGAQIPIDPFQLGGVEEDVVIHPQVQARRILSRQFHADAHPGRFALIDQDQSPVPDGNVVLDGVGLAVVGHDYPSNETRPKGVLDDSAHVLRPTMVEHDQRELVTGRDARADHR